MLFARSNRNAGHISRVLLLPSAFDGADVWIGAILQALAEAECNGLYFTETVRASNTTAVMSWEHT